MDVEEDKIICIRPQPKASAPPEYVLSYVEISKEPEGVSVEERTAYRQKTITEVPQHLQKFIQASDAWLADAQHRMQNKVRSSEFHVVVSTGSGVGKASHVFDHLLAPFLKDAFSMVAPVDYTVHTTTSPTSISTLARETLLPLAAAGSRLSIILLSGDGGMVDLINGFACQASARSDTYQKPNIVLLPLGTGNALAHSSKLTQDATLGLSVLSRGRPREIPLFRAVFDSVFLLDAYGKPTTAEPHENLTVYGAVVVSWGLHASLVGDSDTPEYRKHGSQRFGMAAKDLLFPGGEGSKTHSYRGKVEVFSSRKVKDGAAEKPEWRDLGQDSYAYVLATFLSNLEAKFMISPASKPFDGQLRLVHFSVPDSGGQGIMTLMEEAYQEGKHVHSEAVEYYTIEGLRISFPLEEQEAADAWRWRRICIDGKIYLVPAGRSLVAETMVNAASGFVNLVAPDYS